jgi:nucleotide-binding universal stress UspA family protein
MKRVLVAYDGSAAAPQALAHAAELAGTDDSVSVINVMPEPGISARIEPPSDERYRQRLLLDEALRFLDNSGIRAQCVAAVGDAVTEILAAAERFGGGRDRRRPPSQAPTPPAWLGQQPTRPRGAM